VNGTGEAKAYQVSFASSIAKPYAKAFSAAYASVKAEGANAVVKSDAISGAEEETTVVGESGAAIRGQGIAASRGESEATVTTHPPCQSTPFKNCCEGRFFRRTCYCESDDLFGGSSIGGRGRFGEFGGSNSEPACSLKRLSSSGNTAKYENQAEYTHGGKTYPKGYKCSC